MYKTRVFQISFAATLLLAMLCHAVTITETPVGWASENGGTTGGTGGTVVTVSTLADLQKYASSSSAYIIYLSGTVGTNVTGSILAEASSVVSLVNVASNKTIFGLPGSKLIGRLKLSAVSNVIIRNMTIQGPGAVDVEGVDGINIDKSTNVWVDHCDIYDGQDGNLDITNGSNYITVTYTKFHYTANSRTATGSDGKKAHRYCNLIGNSPTKTSDRTKLKVTMQYDWWADGVKERMPRVRFGQVHVVNNLYTSTLSSTCVRAGQEADLLVEGNAFIGVKNPIDLYDSESLYVVTARNNLFSGTSGTTDGTGTAFTPPYTNVTVVKAELVQGLVTGTLGAGATLCDVRSSNCGTTTSSSSVAVSSSSVKASSSSSATVFSSSSVVVSSSSTAVSSSSATVSSSSGAVVTSSSSAATVPYSAALILEGENYCTADGEVQAEHTGFHGTGYLNLDNTVGSVGAWSVLAAAAGYVNLEIRFANGGTADRGMQILVNGTEQVASQSFAPTGAWTTWQTASVSIAVQKGFNTIALASLLASGGPNIDALGFNAAGLSDVGCVEPASSSSSTGSSSSATTGTSSSSGNSSSSVGGTSSSSATTSAVLTGTVQAAGQKSRTVRCGNALGIQPAGQEGLFSPSGRKIR